MSDHTLGFGARMRGHLGREIIPILALTASVLTFWISFNLSANQQAEAEQRLAAEDVRAAEQEVREILQEINHVRPELISAQDVFTVEALQKDMTLLASQSYQLAGEFGPHLSAFELSSIAEALLDTDQYPEARQIIDMAVVQIQTPSEHLFTYRIQGRILFLLGEVNAGRTAFETALAGHPERKFREGYESAVDAFTEYLWADQELTAHHCDEAQRHLENGNALLQEASVADANAIAPIAAAVDQRVRTCVPESA